MDAFLKAPENLFWTYSFSINVNRVDKNSIFTSFEKYKNFRNNLGKFAW